LTKIIGSAALTAADPEGENLTTKGDLHGYSSENTRIPIGDNDQILTADSAEALGLKWAAPATSKASSYLETVYTLTSVPKKHFVEFFSSDGTVPARWNTTVSGTGAVSMPTGDNEGLSMITGTTATSNAGINFNTISNFDFEDSSCIFISGMSNIGDYETYQGFSDGNTAGSGKGAWLYGNDNNAKFQLATSGGSFTFTPTSIDVDTSSHVFQLVLASANVKLYIDGVLRATNEGNLPDAVLQPFMNMNTADTTSRTLKCIYFEAWNI